MWTCPYCGKDWTHAEVPEMAVCCGEIGHLESLCETCVKADKSCPVYEPGRHVEKCVEYKESEGGSHV